MRELNTMNVDELVELKYEIEAALKVASAGQKVAARRACEALANEHGYLLAELIEPPKAKPGKGQKMPRAHGAPKYRNPDNPAQTWTGKGKRPAWFLTAQEGGMAPERMLIR